VQVDLQFHLETRTAAMVGTHRLERTLLLSVERVVKASMSGAETVLALMAVMEVLVLRVPCPALVLAAGAEEAVQFQERATVLTAQIASLGVLAAAAETRATQRALEVLQGLAVTAATERKVGRRKAAKLRAVAAAEHALGQAARAAMASLE
jgi:hypothetical protein